MWWRGEISESEETWITYTLALEAKNRKLLVITDLQA